ncbi:hypothetical protein Fleli_3065 [Bernardetia litoralis DSM 6794]|uniref:Outer membrane protein beta-barrel domain-containing protein n=1 Tax=Bernardetia litoralis (strain ATCC 23117 / DSM 6794 / NBRC 15988 / NCIMB 1366 / Fx l1 / Sio-4) TaxID=880071 RepID=I4AN70_BERLS|nr:hypothetical protein [Bernardetia litoralis]AFM05405.1 hypothetical protein Fleli_3065 [Bernardetia litoralis DSM 6794]
MKKILLAIALFFFYSVSFAQVEGVEVEKPKEEIKQEEKKEAKKEKDEDEEKIPLIDRFYFGGNFGANFGTVTNITVAPMVGYKITPRFSVGVGGTYQYWSDKRFTPTYTQSIYGGSLFSRYMIAEDFLGTGNLFAHAEYETLFAKEPYQDPNTGLIKEKTKAFPSFLIGGGLAIPIGSRSAFTISALYNPFYDEFNSLYESPLQVRIGGFF